MTAAICIGITILCFGGFILANCLKGHESCRPVPEDDIGNTRSAK